MTHDGTAVCAVCGTTADDMESLATHLVTEAGHSDVGHVMWLNRNVTKHRVDVAALTALLERLAAGGSSDRDRIAR